MMYVSFIDKAHWDSIWHMAYAYCPSIFLISPTYDSIRQTFSNITQYHMIWECRLLPFILINLPYRPMLTKLQNGVLVISHWTMWNVEILHHYCNALSFCNYMPDLYSYSSVSPGWHTRVREATLDGKRSQYVTQHTGRYWALFQIKDRPTGHRNYH